MREGVKWHMGHERGKEMWTGMGVGGGDTQGPRAGGGGRERITATHFVQKCRGT